METINTNENDTKSKEPIQEPTNEDLMNLFEKYSDFTPPTLDWLGLDATIMISEDSILGKRQPIMLQSKNNQQ